MPEFFDDTCSHKAQIAQAETEFGHRTIADKLKEQWRSYHQGKCYILSLGDKCGCHLCLIDKLGKEHREEVRTWIDRYSSIFAVLVSDIKPSEGAMDIFRGWFKETCERID